MKKYLKESILWILILIPFIYLWLIWNSLPPQIATHFDFEGNPNGWTDKNSLIYLLGGLGICPYIIMLFIPILDPKKKIEQMGDKYFFLRLLMTFFMTGTSVYILYNGNGNKINPGLIIGFLGLFFAVLGNYFQTVKPNYFIGIRTPWTLENENTWKSTHRLAGRIWMAGGILIVLFSFITESNSLLWIVFGIITGIMVIVPVVYSYIEFKKLHT
jgi:uncharacterized membrane protein